MLLGVLSDARARVIVGLVCAVAAAWAGAVPAAATSSTVSGVVRDMNGGGIVGATVSVTTAGGTLTTTSVAYGTYTFTLDVPGTYTFSASMTNYQPESVTALVSGSAPTIILPPLGTYHVQGTLLSSDNVALGGQTVHLQSGGADVSHYFTDPSGHFDLYAPAGSYVVAVTSQNTDPTIHAPQDYALFSTTTLAVSGDTTLDLTLPAVDVHVCLKDPTGAAVAGAILGTDDSTSQNLTFNGFQGQGWDWYEIPNNDPKTGDDGCGDLWLFPGSQIRVLTITPSSSGLAVVSYQFQATAGTLPFTVPYPVVLSGRVLDGLGAGVPGQTVKVSTDGVNWVAAAPTDASGLYNFPNLAPGSYQVQLSGTNTTLGVDAPAHYQLTSAAGSTLALSTSTNVDLPLPEMAVTVTALAGTTAVAGVTLTAPGQALSGLGVGPLVMSGESDYASATYAVTGAGGQAVLWLFGPVASPYTVTGTPAAGTPYLSGTGAVAVPASSGSGSGTVPLVGPATLSGHVYDGLGHPLAGQSVSVVVAGVGTAFGGVTDSSGAYAIPSLPPASYLVTVSGTTAAGAAAPPSYTWAVPGSVSVAGATSLDLSLPVRPVGVSVSGPAGGVAGFGVSVAGVYPLSAGVVTDSSGQATVWLFDGSWSVAVATPNANLYASPPAQTVGVAGGPASVGFSVAYLYSPPTVAVSVSVVVGSSTVSLAATSHSVWPVASVYYSLDGGAPVLYSAPLVFTDVRASHSISAWAVDVNGAVGPRASQTFYVGAVDRAQLCALVTAYVSKAGVAHALCEELKEVRHPEHLRAWVHEIRRLEAQGVIRFSWQADELVGLASLLAATG